MTKKIILGLVAVAVVGLVAAPASAACIPDKAAVTYGAQPTYWHSANSNPGTMLGQSWQVGGPGIWNSGSGTPLDCNNIDQGSGSPGFIYQIPGTDKVGLNLHMGSCGTGCPANGATVAMAAYKSTAQGTEFLIASVAETPAAAFNFDYSQQGDHNLAPLPRPRVTSSSKAGTIVTLNIAADATLGGVYGSASSVTGYRILSAQSATEPGRNAAAYTLRGTIGGTGGAAGTGQVTVDCGASTADIWVVTALNLENGGVAGGAVSAPTRVNCNPNLADPKFKIVPKKSTGLGQSEHNLNN